MAPPINEKMKRSSGIYYDDKRSSHQEDSYRASRSKSEEKRIHRRREWLIQQEREKEHERLKQKMILEYEIRRAREKGLPLPKRRSPHRSRSKSRSKSADSRHKRRSSSSRRQPIIMSEKVESSTKTSIFKSSEGTQIDTSELHKIKVDIHRNIPVSGASTSKLERDIINPEDVMVKRRDGEGSTSIFEREELKQSLNKFEEIEERRTVYIYSASSGEGSKPIFEREELKRLGSKCGEIEEHRIVSVDNKSSVIRSDRSKRRSVSVSPLRKRSHSPRRTSSRHSRHEGLTRRDESNDYRNDRKYSRDRSRGRSTECKEKYRTESRHRSSPPCHAGDSHSRQRRSHHYSRDRSQERKYRNWSRDPIRSKDGRSHREYCEKSRDRSRERRDRGRSRERTPPAPHYIEQVPVPVYYGNFPPRPIVVGPMVPFRGQLPMPRGRPLLGPMRPFHPPRFTGPDMFRIGAPPRFGPMF